jgi:sarcosine oxidase subunit beta
MKPKPVTSADVVIIGGGIIGCAIAYYLSKERVRVALVERGALACGASGACGGFLFLQSKRPGFMLEWAKESLALYRRLSDELESDLHYQPNGGVIVATTREEEDILSAQVAALRQANVSVEMRRREDALPVFSRSVRCFSFCADDAAVHPQRVVQGFAQKAQKNGAVFLMDTPAIGIETHQERVNGVITTRGRISAPIVINAAGVFAPEVARWVDVELPIHPRRGQLMETHPLPHILSCPILDARYLKTKFSSRSTDNSNVTVGLSLQQRLDGTVVIGGTREWAGFEAETTPQALSAMQRRAAQVIPTLRHASIARSYAGLRPATNDGLPILGFVHRPAGFCIVAGHEGDGVTLAPVTGKTVAHLVRQGNNGEQVGLVPQRFGERSSEARYGG